MTKWQEGPASPVLEEAARKRREHPSKVEMRVKDWLETSGKFSGWPEAEYDQVVGSYIFPVLFRSAGIVVDIEHNSKAAPLNSRSSYTASLRAEAARNQGFRRFSVNDAEIWGTSVRKAFDPIFEVLEREGFIARVNPIEAIKDALYKARHRRDARTRQTLREKRRRGGMRARSKDQA